MGCLSLLKTILRDFKKQGDGETIKLSPFDIIMCKGKRAVVLPPECTRGEEDKWWRC